MTSDSEQPDPLDDGELGEFLKGLGEHLRRAKEHDRRQHELAESAEAVLNHAEAVGDAIIVPMGVDSSEVPEPYAELLHGLMNEQSKASLFMGQLPAEHGYRRIFEVLSRAWSNAAMIGALQIAKHNVEHHHTDEIEVGPVEHSAAWSVIAMSSVLGAVRFGQANPDAFKGLEGLKPGEIDDTVAQLIAWAAQQVEDGKGGEAASE